MIRFGCELDSRIYGTSWDLTVLPWRRRHRVYAERWYTSVLQRVKLKTKTASVAVFYNIRACNVPRARIGDGWPSPLRHAWFRRNWNTGECILNMHVAGIISAINVVKSKLIFLNSYLDKNCWCSSKYRKCCQGMYLAIRISRYTSVM